MLTAVVRENAGRLTGALVRRLGDFDLAEEAVQDAIVSALEHWPAEGIPERPDSWLITVARRRAIDIIRRRKRLEDKLALIAATGPEPSREADDRLRLIFTCCHPALSREAQLALTLRAVVGLTTPEVARAFLQSEETIAQRIVRAKRKIVQARIPYSVPGPDEFPERLEQVLAVLYLMFNEGYLATSGAAPTRRDLESDAEWLAALVAQLLPREPEARGLLALIQLHRARSAARFDSQGGLVLLEDQDRSLWDSQAIRAAGRMLEEALAVKRPGPYQVQAAIAACHAEAPFWEATDWRQIGALYSVLETFWPTSVVRLNRAIALSHVAGPGAALVEIDALAPSLDRYHLFHATRGRLLRALGRLAEARESERLALALTANPAERRLLEDRLGLGPPD